MMTASAVTWPSRRKWLLAAVGLPVLIGAWWAFRPEKLWINEKVNEPAPFGSSLDPQALYTGRLAQGRREPLLTFVVAGGGFAGVETVAAVNDMLRQALPLYRNLNEKMLRLVLVQPGQVILPELGEGLGRYAQTKLQMRGIETFANNRVAAVTDDSVTLADGTVIRSAAIVWTAGTTPNPLLTGYHAARIEDEWW